MDGPRFDALAKAWSTTRPRRALLKGVAGGIGAGLLAAGGVKPAAAACTQYGRTCGRDGDCCSENCVDGTCACRTGKTRCGTRCVDLRNNENHCGACDTPCPEDQTCRDGHCGCAQYGAACTGEIHAAPRNCVEGNAPAAKGRTRCGKRCVNTAADDSNCGACGNRCPAGVTCENGRCGVPCTSDRDCKPAGACIDGACTTAFVCYPDSNTCDALRQAGDPCKTACTSEGTGVRVTLPGGCPDANGVYHQPTQFPVCVRTADCGPNEACIGRGCCTSGERRCFPLCPG